MPLSKDHYIELKDGITQDDFNNLITSIASDPNRDHITLFFHGGLVNIASAMQTAEALTARYQNVPTYPIFFIWETGVDEVIQQEGLLNFVQSALGQVGQEEIFKQLLMRILQFAKAKVDSTKPGSQRSVDGGLSLPDEAAVWQELHALQDGREPYAGVNPTLPANEKLQDDEKKQFHDTLTQDPNPTLQDEVQKILNGYRQTKQADTPTPQDTMRAIDGAGSTTTTLTLIDPSVLQQMDRQSSEGAERGIGAPALEFVSGKALEVLSHVIDRYANKTDHGLYTTVVEEILRAFYLSNVGKNIWDHIKQAVTDAFLPDHGGTMFLQSLKDYCASDHNLHITLVGHSAGSIYACQLLQYADKVFPPEVTFDVVFLAPACTDRLFADTLDACKDRISSIRVFAMNDQLEQADVIAPGIYTRSLLYLVSGLFEDAPDTSILGMQRFFSNEAPFNSRAEIPPVVTYLNVSQRNNVWSLVDADDGLSSHAQKHGAFFQDDVTLASLGYILTNGFGDGTK